MMVKATVSEVIRTRVPEWVAEKDMFMKFVEYYYEWMEQEGKPTKFLRSIGEKTDIDQIEDEYVELILNKIISFIPSDVKTDRRFLTKHIREFLRSKGTEESLSFIMKAVFDEEAYRVPMQQFVMRASDNEYTQDGYVALEVDIDTDFSDAIGSTLVQLGIPASAKIEGTQFRALPDGRTFWLVKFDPRKVNGSFEIGRECRAIKNDSDLTFNEIKEYSVVTHLDTVTKQIRFTSDYEFTFFEGELMLGLDEVFRGVISNVVQYLVINEKHDYTIQLESYTGSISDGAEIYLTTTRDEFEHITKNSFCYGKVSPSAADFEVIESGSGYYEGIPITFDGGSGDGVSGYIGEISPGSVDEIIILNGGSGYQAGDKITVDDAESNGYGFDAEVEAVDGVGADIHAVMEIDDIYISGSGYAYSVGDEFEIHGLDNEKKTNLKIQVNSVAGVATPELKNFKILNYGTGYTTTRAALIKNQNVSYNSTANTLSLTGAATQITGLSVAHYKPNATNSNYAIDAAAKSSMFSNSIVDVEILEFPTPHADLTDSYLIFNGVGATATANVNYTTPVNLFKHSQQFDNASWVKTRATPTANTTTSPDGTITADTLTGDGTGASYAYQGITLTQYQTYTFSCYIKAGSFSGAVSVKDYTEAGEATFNLTTLATSNTGIATGVSVGSVGNGWYRLSAVFTPTTVTGSHNLAVGNFTSTGTVYFWGAQLETGTTATTYIETQAGTIGTWPTEYIKTETTSVTTADGLRTNLISYSEQFDNAYWSKVRATITANATTAPDGTLTAEKLVEDTQTGAHHSAKVFSFTSGVTYVGSVYVKAGERTKGVIQLGNGVVSFSGGTANCTYDLVAKTASKGTNGLSAGIQELSGGWFRVWISGTAGSSGSDSFFASSLHNGTGTSYTGDNTSGLYIWGAQLEVFTPGIIASIDVDLNGINYANPKIKISDTTGVGAIAEATKDSNGTITGISVISGGTGYSPRPTVQLYDAAGSGFIATAICDTISSGEITGVSMVGGDLGEFISLPPNSENIPYSTMSEGYGAKFDLTYKIKSLHVENTGYGYQSINSPELKFTGGIGSGFTFIPVIGGSTDLTNVIITNGGRDYATASTIKFTGGSVDATANLTVVNGVITKVTITGGGSGFTYDPTDSSTNCVAVIDEIGPSAAQAEPDVTISLGGTGEILGAVINSNGSNYTTASVLVDGDYVSPATLVANIFTGVDLINVTSIGLPGAFNINSLNTWNRITDAYGKVQVLTTYTTTISGGTGGKVSCYVTKEGQLAVDSKGDPMIWISVAGTGYTTPTATVGDVVDKRPTIYFGCSRGIESITVSAGGSGYSPLSSFTIIGDGQNASATPIIAGSLGVESVTLNVVANTNKGFITAPTITIEDTTVSRVGKISKIKIIDGGSGFRKFPKIKCEVYDIENIIVDGQVSQVQVPKPDRIATPTGYFPYGIGAKLVAVSKTIGRVKRIEQKDFGFGYEDVPEIKFPVSIVVRDTTGFRLNEPASSSPVSTRDISDSLDKITTNGTSIVVMYLNNPPTGLGIFAGQKITVSGLHADVNKSYTVKSINLVDRTIQLNGGISFTTGEYVNVSATVTLTDKAGKIIGIDPMRNLIWVDNVDNIFDCEEDVGYLAEDGSTIVTEFFAVIQNDLKLYGHKSGRSSDVMWLNKAYFTAKKASIGKTAKYFSSKNSMLSENQIKMINSLNIQDYSFEVHTGLSLNFYERLLRDTVHPAGYYMQGVLDDVEVITDDLIMNLAEKRTGTLGDEVFLIIQMALASLYALLKTKETTEYLYQNREILSAKTLLRSIQATTPAEFDLWTYPEHSIWRTDEDGKKYYNWLYTHLPPIELNVYPSSVTLDYTQTSDTITYVLNGHSFEVGDVLMHVTPSDDLCGRSFRVYSKTVNNFTTKNKLNEVSGETGIKIIKVASAPVSATFTKSGSVFTITKNGHGLIGDANTWVYVDIPTGNTSGSWIYDVDEWVYIANPTGNDTGVQYKTHCCLVINATTNTFQVDGLSDDNVGVNSGNMTYRVYTPEINTMVKQARVRDVSYSIASTVVTVSGLTNHDLQVGNILLVETSNGIFDYVRITETTESTVKFDDIGITGTLDISFTFDSYIPAIGYRT